MYKRQVLHHQGTRTLHTRRLTLRRFVEEDARQMFDGWACDERVTRFLTWTPHDSPQLTAALLKDWCAAYENPSTYNWAIEWDGRLIGNISVVQTSDRSEWAELGYCLGHAYWNQGLMTEAVRAVLGYLFEEVGCHRIGLSHAVRNPASGRVARKCGMTYEGTRRALFRAASGEFLDIAEYGMLRAEWDAAGASE